MRNRTVSLLLFAAVALVAIYGRRSLSRSAPSSPSSVIASETLSSGDSESADGADGSSRRRHGGPSHAHSAPGVFDFYLLNLSWSPEFCSTHPGKPECAAHPRFVLHGLWPQNNDGTYPENCSQAPGPADPGAFSDILPDAGLLTHEWQTHGTCSGLSPDAYFALARKAVHEVTIPSSLAQITAPASRPPDAILTDFKSSNPSFPDTGFALSCGNNYLTAVEVCLDKSLAAIACSQVRSCRANTVRIVPPGGAN